MSKCGDDCKAGRVVQSKKLFFSLLILIIIFHPTYAVVKGSNTAVSIEAATTFPAADNDNTMLGFGWFKNGFTLEDSLTTCTFNSVFPISGTVDLKGGTLYLEQDLILRDVILQSSGKLFGYNHTIQLHSSTQNLSTNSSLIDSARLFCSTNLEVITTVTFSGDCILFGVGNVLTLRDNANLIIDEGSTLELRDIEIQGIKDSNIRCIDDNGRMVLDSVRWMQSDTFTWSKGSILFKDQVSFIGTNTFTYASSQTSTIDSSSAWTIGEGIHVCMGRDFNTLNEPLEMVDSTAMLKFNNCDLIVSASGMQFTKGTIILDRTVNLDAIATTTEHGIIIGDGDPDHDVTIWLSPGAAVNHKSGYWVYNNTTADKFNSAALSTRLIRDVGSLIYLPQNLTIKNFAVELLSNLVMPMQVATGKTVNYEKASVRLPDVEFDITANQLNAITYQLANGGEIFFIKGAFPLFTQVQGTGNKLRGNGGITGLITLEDSTAELNCGVTGFIDNIVTLNNGKIILDNNISMLAHSGIVGPGTIDLQSNELTFLLGTINVTSPMYWQGDNGSIRLEGKLSLSSTWTVGGKCIINGNNNRIILDTDGEIVVDKGAELVLKNAEIQGIKNNNIKCLDENGRITFLNTQWFLDNNYSFTIGAIQFYRLNHITGPYTFSYDSPQTSTIKSDAKVILRDDMTLEIGRNGTSEPLDFEDDSGVLKFDNSKFKVKSSGMQLTRGIINTSRDVEVEIASAVEAGSLVFGNGTAADDMEFVLNPGSTARFTTGHVTFNVTSGNGIRSKSKTAQLVRNANSAYLLKQNLTLENITIDIDPLSSLTVDSGKTLDYKNVRLVLAQGVFDLTGVRYSNTTSLLNGNHKITVINGDMPLATLVQGSGNTIEGTGNITGPVILQPASAFTTGLNGSYFANITLSNGTVTLSHDLNLANGIILTGPGMVDIGLHNVNFGSSNLEWPTDTHWNMTNGSLNMHGNIDLQGTWTFDGTGEIKGSNHILNLGTTGKLVINPNSTLYLRDINLENISSNNIECLGDATVLVIDNMRWDQRADVDFTFTTGAIRFKNKVTMHGDSRFIYQTSQTSTICDHSRLKLDEGFTFSYDPIGGDKQLIAFEDGTAELILNSASLHATTTGLQLTKGNLSINGDSFISSELLTIEDDDDINLTTIDEGIILGNGVDSNNDVTCSIAAGAKLNLTQGSLVYNNVSSAAWKTENTLSALICAADTRLSLQQSINMGVGKLLVSKNTLIDALPNKSITGAVFIID